MPGASTRPAARPTADASGKSNAGTLNGATRTATGKFGRAVSFDGVNDFVSVADSSSLDLSKGMTLEAWVNPSVATGGRTVVFKENLAAKRPSYALYASNNNKKPTAEITAGSSLLNVAGSELLPANTWSHIAATYDGATLRVFRNGVLIGSRARHRRHAELLEPAEVRRQLRLERVVQGHDRRGPRVQRARARPPRSWPTRSRPSDRTPVR